MIFESLNEKKCIPNISYMLFSLLSPLKILKTVGMEIGIVFIGGGKPCNLYVVPWGAYSNVDSCPLPLRDSDLHLNNHPEHSGAAGPGDTF